MTFRSRLTLVFKNSLHLFTANMASAVRLLWPFAVLGVLQYEFLAIVTADNALANAIANRLQISLMVFKILSVAYLLLAASVAVAWYRCLLQAKAPGWFAHRFGLREFLVWLPLFGVYSIHRAFAFACISAGNHLDIETATGPYGYVFSVLALLVYMLLAPLGLRLALILPAIATDRKIAYLLNMRPKDFYVWYCQFGRGFGLPMAITGLGVVALYKISIPLFLALGSLAFWLAGSVGLGDVSQAPNPQLTVLVYASFVVIKAWLFLGFMTVIYAAYRIVLAQITTGKVNTRRQSAG
ncbi:hypothetical protein FJU08_00875 [Martelella alba]|uniref:Uncharacterized protein n=1 Tax=Martelella alba TaxID=2590451 RepID=A0A506UIJ0_9HYPH|nr:hypothetical protein [Martelella alba]TPW33151.1 hypothetical protein FJU08_00875 [Martelella alba]